jgi:hypothetical protein
MSRRKSLEVKEAELTAEQLELASIILEICCTSCTQIKFEYQFPVNRSNALGFDTICKLCSEKGRKKLELSVYQARINENRLAAAGLV